MMVCIDSSAADKHQLIHFNDKIKDELYSRQYSKRPMVMFKSISVSPDWSRVHVNFREVQSKIDYSVWCDVPATMSWHSNSLRLLHTTVSQFAQACKKDHMLREKTQDQYFCFGLIKHIQKRIPGCSTTLIGHTLSYEAGLKQAEEWLHTHFTAQTELSLLNEEKDGKSVFGNDMGVVQLYEGGDGFYTLECGGRSYNIDLDWIGQSSGGMNVLGIMLERGAIGAIDLLFATDKFKIDDVRNLVVEIHPKAFLHLVEKYGFDINAQDSCGNTQLLKVMIELQTIYQNYDHYTYLSFDSYKTPARIIKLSSNIEFLLKNGADPTIRNAEGLNAYDIAKIIKPIAAIKESKSHKIIAVLKSLS